MMTLLASLLLGFGIGFVMARSREPVRDVGLAVAVAVLIVVLCGLS
jgi:hypothetical protein